MESEIGSEHPFNLLVQQCLHNSPNQRPSARALFDRLKRLNDEDCNSLYGSAEVSESTNAAE